MKKGQKETKVTKATTAKPKTAAKKAASAKVAPKKEIKEIAASSASPLTANETRASPRRNAAFPISPTLIFETPLSYVRRLIIILLYLETLLT